MTKIIAMHIKSILLGIVTLDQFGFLKGHLVHKAIRFDHEGIHSIKIHQSLVLVIKLDLSKAYDIVS